MLNPQNLLTKAEESGFYRWLLNRSLNYMIPFNKPHGIQVIGLSKNKITTRLPYHRKNLNHLNGLHAMALATISEFTTGVILLKNLGAEYRLILQRLDIQYLYQGKTDATAHYEISTEWLESSVKTPLENSEAVIAPCEIKVEDTEKNQLTSAQIYWQLKPWSKVKTRR